MDLALYTVGSERFLFQSADYLLGQQAHGDRKANSPIPGVALLPTNAGATRRAEPLVQGNGPARLHLSSHNSELLRG